MGNVRGRGLVLALLLVLGGLSYLGFGGVLGSSDSEAKNQSWSLMVGGDVMLGRSVNTRSLKYKDFNYPFIELKSRLETVDIAMVNLENPVVQGCRPTDRGMVFCSPPESLMGLRWAGIDVVNLDNNHTGNYGTGGYLQTKTFLGQYGIGFFDNENIWIREVAGVRLGAIGFDLVGKANKKQVDEVVERVKSESAGVDVLVVNLHWGEEYKSEPEKWMRDLALRMVQSGADLIVGHHSHVIGRYEEIDGVPVIYSLGNLVFDQMWSMETREGMMVRFDFEGTKIKGREFLPVRIFDYAQPRFIENETDQQKLIERFLGYSQQGSL